MFPQRPYSSTKWTLSGSADTLSVMYKFIEKLNYYFGQPRTPTKENPSPKWTEVSLGKEVGVSRPKIHRWLIGKNEPNVSELYALARAFGVAVIDLLGESSLMTHQGDTDIATLLGIAEIVGLPESIDHLNSQVPAALRRKEEAKRARNAANHSVPGTN